MEQIAEFITRHAHYAHWYLFGALLLAGFNIPFSADVLILIAALLAATVVPENTGLLFGSVLIGCYLSAMCAYWVGRVLGSHLHKVKFFSKLLPLDRMNKIKRFYEKHGIWTLLLGRFIPFGVRNCIFMSSGISKLSFGKFILLDALACSLWCSVLFFLFYSIGHNFQALWQTLKAFNLFIFAGFSVTVIGIIWYKIRKNARLNRISVDKGN